MRRALFAVVVMASTLFLPATPASAAAPGWITTCQYSHTSHDDPIVFPGLPGAAHLHDFVGATTTDAFSTFTSLSAGGTTCVMEGDTSAYWVPALYEDGVLVPPTGTQNHSLFYYRRKGVPDGDDVQPFPNGLRMILGNAKAQSPADNPWLDTGDIIFKCGPGSGTDLPHPPDQCDSGILVISMRFPNCWDGVNLDSPDHLSHMSYPKGSKCPDSHPVGLPRLEGFFRYDVGTDPINMRLASGEYWTAHQDFFNAWNPGDLQWLLDNCMNAMKDCGENPDVPGTPEIPPEVVGSDIPALPRTPPGQLVAAPADLRTWCTRLNL